MSVQVADRRRFFEGPREIQAVLVEWEPLSPMCARLRLREWEHRVDSSKEVVSHGDSASSDAARV
jgi:hypothetical protein